MEPISPFFAVLYGTLTLVVPLIMWSEAYVIWRAMRKAGSIAALRQLFFSSLCRASAITIVSLLILDNLWGIHLIEDVAPRVFTTVAFVLIVLPAVRFLLVYFNRGFRTEGDAIRIVEKPKNGQT